ncbi:hypothetical protein PMAYCL1PPCAC_23819, partial [Pristionchus mayeri]
YATLISKQHALSATTISHSVFSSSDLTPCLLLGLLLDVHGCLSRLRNHIFLLGENNLHVARRRHIGVDTSVSTVRASAHLCSTLHLDVVNDQMIDIESLIFGVALSVSEQLKNIIAGLHRPPSLSGLECLALSLSANSTLEFAERDDLFLLHHIGEVTLSALERHSSDGRSNLTGVLEVNTEIRPLGLARLRAILGLSGVMNLGHRRGLP